MEEKEREKNGKEKKVESALARQFLEGFLCCFSLHFNVC